jgi:hypothetical protein
MLVLLTGFAGILQASRLPFRWNAICIAYASYFKEYQHNIEVEGWTAAFTTFVGLHPPLYSLLFHAQESLALPPIAWLSISGILSVGSVPLVWLASRRLYPEHPALAWVAASVLAMSPHRVAYGLEVNDYPLMVFTTTAQLLAFAHYSQKLQRGEEGRRKAGLLWMLATVLALWSHVLTITLPAAQVLTLALLPETRRHLKGALGWMSAAALPCLVLLPEILSRGDAPPINQAVGILGALESFLIGFPGRYGSALGAYLLGAALILGACVLLRSSRTGRLASFALLVHLLLTGTAILWMVSTGTAASHQYPYYLALLPTAALVIAAAVRPLGQSRRPLLAGVLIASALSLHGLVLGSDALRARDVVRSAPTERALMALAVQEWTPGSSLVLIDFPTWTDDDKDVLDPTWALLPITEPVDFAHPQVPTLVTADPYWGQPVRFGKKRWLYTFTGWPPSDGSVERMDVIANHVAATESKLILAIYNTDQAYGDFARAEAWAMRRGRLGRSAPSQALWVIDPSAQQNKEIPATD